MNTIFVQIPEDTEGLINPKLVMELARLPCVENEDHAGIECLLTHCPADESSFLAVPEKHESLEDLD